MTLESGSRDTFYSCACSVLPVIKAPRAIDRLLEKVLIRLHSAASKHLTAYRVSSVAIIMIIISIILDWHNTESVYSFHLSFISSAGLRVVRQKMLYFYQPARFSVLDVVSLLHY